MASCSKAQSPLHYLGSGTGYITCCHNITDVTIITPGYLQGNGGWDEVIEYNGIRYYVRLSRTAGGNGIEDEIMSRLEDAYDQDHIVVDQYGTECRYILVPLIKQHYASLSEMEKTRLSISKALVNIEGHCDGGGFHAVQHNCKLAFRTEPIQNTFPHMRTIRDSEIRLLAQLEFEVFLVKHGRRQYCLKTVHSKGGGLGLAREISILQQCHHPNIVPIYGIVVNNQGNVSGMLIEYIPHAITLAEVDLTDVTNEQYDLWITQIGSALAHLHSKSLCWGDAKPCNNLKRGCKDDLVLVDFAGGATDWIFII